MSPTDKPRRRVDNPPSKEQKLSKKWVYIAVVVIIAIVAIAVVILLNSMNTQNDNESPSENPVAVFNTSLGTFKVELFLDKVPITAENFIDHATSGYYDGVIFHRVIKNFMIQSGDPRGDGTGGHAAEYHEGYGNQANPDTWVIPDEFREDLSNVNGTISMANRGADTGGSQFFINVVDNAYLDYYVQDPSNAAHAVFGRVIEGMDVVMTISQVDTGSDTKPEVDVVIQNISIET